MQVLISIFALIIILGILVFVHEFGHFIVARLSGMRADIFSLGMGKRLLGYNKKTGFSFGNLEDEYSGEGITDYRISLFPIGGYVKIVGMIDESMDKDALKGEMKPWEFRARPRPFQLAVLLAGVVMNFILAIVLYTIISMGMGGVEIDITEIGYVEKGAIGDVIGFQSGDQVKAINDIKVESWEQIEKFLISNDALNQDFVVQIERNGSPMELRMENKKYLAMLTDQKLFGISPAGTEIFLNMVQDKDPAAQAGLKVGDTIVSLAGEKILISQQIIKIVKSHIEKPMELQYKRGNEIITTTVTPNKSGLIGISMGVAYDKSLVKHIEYSLGEAIQRGFKESINTVAQFKVVFSKIFQGSVKAKDTLGGPIMIAQLAGQTFNLGFYSFIQLMAMLSVSLAVLNLLPIPALDGGQIVIVLIEGIMRRELPEKLKLIIQQIGLFIILALMVFVFYNDIARVIGF